MSFVYYQKNFAGRWTIAKSDIEPSVRKPDGGRRELAQVQELNAEDESLSLKQLERVYPLKA